MQRFSGKAVVVTGAAQGIGRGVALAAAEEGAKALLVDRAELVYEVQAEIAAAGGQAEIRRSLFPTLWCCRAVLPHMVERQQGVIVNVSSIATRGIYRIPYSAAKGGVNALTASLALEHAGDNIRVNAVATGGTEAPPRKIPRNAAPMSEQETVWYQGIVDQTIACSPMHRYGTIGEQVRAILFLASDEASYITGTVLPVGGGDLG